MYDKMCNNKFCLTGKMCITSHTNFQSFLIRTVLANTLWLLIDARGGSQHNTEPSSEYDSCIVLHIQCKNNVLYNDRCNIIFV